MSRGTIDFYFDIISPYSYVAFEALLQHEIPLKINFKPVSIGHVFKASGISHPKPIYIKPFRKQTSSIMPGAQHPLKLTSS